MRSYKVFIYSKTTIECCVFITANFEVSDTRTNIQEPTTEPSPIVRMTHTDITCADTKEDIS